jgi:hypothetical protein
MLTSGDSHQCRVELWPHSELKNTHGPLLEPAPACMYSSLEQKNPCMKREELEGKHQSLQLTISESSSLGDG